MRLSNELLATTPSIFIASALPCLWHGIIPNTPPQRSSQLTRRLMPEENEEICLARSARLRPIGGGGSGSALRLSTYHHPALVRQPEVAGLIDTGSFSPQRCRLIPLSINHA